MRTLLVVSTLALLVSSARAEEPPARVERFQCFTKGSEDLAKPGGGPAASHWNPEAIRCEVDLDWRSAARGVRLDLRFGQGKKLTLVGRRHAIPDDGLAPHDTAPEEALANTQRFLLPAALVDAAMKRKTRDKATGAHLYPLRLELSVTDVAPRGGAKPRRRALDFVASTGE